MSRAGGPRPKRAQLEPCLAELVNAHNRLTLLRRAPECYLSPLSADHISAIAYVLGKRTAERLAAGERIDDRGLEPLPEPGAPIGDELARGKRAIEALAAIGRVVELALAAPLGTYVRSKTGALVEIANALDAFRASK
jgi:hypothetical protein